MEFGTSNLRCKNCRHEWEGQMTDDFGCPNCGRKCSTMKCPKCGKEFYSSSHPVNCPVCDTECLGNDIKEHNFQMKGLTGNWE